VVSVEGEREELERKMPAGLEAEEVGEMKSAEREVDLPSWAEAQAVTLARTPAW
jgi:hypothetical protein